MSPTELKTDADRLKAELKEVDGLLNAQSESVEEMLDFLLNFSELLKNASLLYKFGTEAEKRQIVHTVFSELTFTNKMLASYKAKPEFDVFLKRPISALKGTKSDNGSPGWTRTNNPVVNSHMLYH